MKYVLDSSVALKWVLVEQHSDKANRPRADFQAGVHELLAPDIFPGEVGHGLTRAERQGRITIGEAIRLWSDVMTTSPQLVVSSPLTHRAIVISSQTRVILAPLTWIPLDFAARHPGRKGCKDAARTWSHHLCWKFMSDDGSALPGPSPRAYHFTSRLSTFKHLPSSHPHGPLHDGRRTTGTGGT